MGKMCLQVVCCSCHSMCLEHMNDTVNHQQRRFIQIDMYNWSIHKQWFLDYHGQSRAMHHDTLSPWPRILCSPFSKPFLYLLPLFFNFVQPLTFHFAFFLAICLSSPFNIPLSHLFLLNITAKHSGFRAHLGYVNLLIRILESLSCPICRRLPFSTASTHCRHALHCDFDALHQCGHVILNLWVDETSIMVFERPTKVESSSTDLIIWIVRDHTLISYIAPWLQDKVFHNRTSPPFTRRVFEDTVVKFTLFLWPFTWREEK